MKKTLRLLMPQWQGGTGPDYTFGARMLAWLAPEDKNSVLVEVPCEPHIEMSPVMENGMYARSVLLKQMRAATGIISENKPERIVTFGGDCLVSQAPIAYLNELYDGNLAVLWVDSHPDISNTSIFPNGNAMVVGNLLGIGDPEFSAEVKTPLRRDHVMYAGIQPSTNSDEQEIVESSGIRRAGPKELANSSSPVTDWIKEQGIKHIYIHLDVDVIDPALFHSNIFEKPAPISTDCSKGEMSFEQLARLFNDVSNAADVVGFSITEHFPWDMMELSKLMSAQAILNGGQR